MGIRIVSLYFMGTTEGSSRSRMSLLFSNFLVRTSSGLGYRLGATILSTSSALWFNMLNPSATYSGYRPKKLLSLSSFPPPS
jgi:hypothetical protein